MAEPTMSLSDLPEPVLHMIIRQLTAQELARVLVQDSRLKLICSEEAIWQYHALRRWPQCSADHHDGSWRVLYCARSQLPSGLPMAVDRCRHLTLRAAGRQMRFNSSSLPGSPASSSPAGSPVKANVYGIAHRPHTSIPGMLFVEVMQQVFNIGLLTTQCCKGKAASSICSSSSSSSSSFCSTSSSTWHSSGSGSSTSAGAARELQLHRQDLVWWLTNRPEALFEFVRSTLALLHDYSPWEGGASRPAWPEVTWRRSAAQFLWEQLARGPLGPGAGVCASVGDRLARDLSRLDAAMRSPCGQGPDQLGLAAPQGVPSSHWWWWGATGQQGRGGPSRVALSSGSS